MFAVYSTPSHTVYTPQVVYTTPRRTSIYQEAYLNALAEAQLARQRYVEEQRALTAWRAQQEVFRQEERRRRQLNALQNNLNRRRLPRSYVLTSAGCIPVRSSPSYPSLWELSNSGDVSPTLLAQNTEYETELEAFRRRKAEQARAEYLSQFERARKEREAEAHTEYTKQLAAIEQIRRGLGIKPSNHNEDHNVARDKPIENPVKPRKVEDSDRIRKAAIHNARARFIETVQKLANEFNAQVPNPFDTAGNPSAFTPLSVPKEAGDLPPDYTIHTVENPPKGFEQHADGAKLRRRREVAARIIQRRWRSRSAEVAAEKDALNTIGVLRSRFEFLQSSFTPPEHLKFNEAFTEKPTLLFSSENAPLNAFTHELDKLLSLADGIPSGGNERVRTARKMFVTLVEEALKKTETLIQDIWNRQKSTQSETVSIPISDSGNTPIIESTVVATSPLGTSFDTSSSPSSGSVLERTTRDVSMNEPASFSSSTSSGQEDSTIIITSTSDVNLVKTSEAEAAIKPHDLVDILPNAPASHIEDVFQVRTEAYSASISVPDVEASPTLPSTTTLEIDTDINPISYTPSAIHSVEFQVSSSAEGEDITSDVPIEVRDVTALQIVNDSVPVTPDLINNPDLDKEGEVAIDHAKSEDQGDANSNHDSDSATINEGYPETSRDHADASLLSDDQLDIVSETKQPLSEASNPVADAGEDRDVSVQASTLSDDDIFVATSEAAEMTSQMLELNSNSALDAMQSIPIESSSPSSDVESRTNEHSTSTSSDLSASPKPNIEDGFDVIYPDSPSSDGPLEPQEDADTGPSNPGEFEVKSSAGSDDFELL